MAQALNSLANTGIANISVANPNLDGSGTLGTVLTAEGANGTAVNSVTVKATGSTSEGMVRLFVFDGKSYFLWKEISIPSNQQTDVVSAFEITITEQIVLNPGNSLMASTQNAESFNVIANGTDWSECPCSINPAASLADMQVQANTGMVNIKTPNPNLDGSGPMGAVLKGTGIENSGGTVISSINIKAAGPTEEGMVRLFINNQGTNFLFREVAIPASVPTDVEPAFRTELAMGLYLTPGYTLLASTQQANSFNVVTHAVDLINCPCVQ